MMDDRPDTDAEIIRAAYAEKVKEAFKVFAENLGTGENPKSSQERFVRAMELVRKARDMALVALDGGSTREAAELGATAADRNEADAAPAGDGLSAEDQAMIEQALAGTTGQKPLHRR